MQYLLVALGGALGSVLRFAIGMGMRAVLPATFPWGTLTVNLVGSFLAGLLYALIVERQLIAEQYLPLVFAGFLGGFTTYSAYAVESWRMFDSGNIVLGIGYIAGTTVLCLLFTALGVILARGF